MTAQPPYDAERMPPDVALERDAELDPGARAEAGRVEAGAFGGDPRRWAGVAAAGRRGGDPALGRRVFRLQAQAGNDAVAHLLGREAAGPRGHRRTGPVLRHAAAADAPGADARGAETDVPVPGPGSETALDDPASAPAPPAPTSSFTKVGPPTWSSYTVSGTLREAAGSVAARPEAGATTTTPDLNMADNGKRPTQVQVTVTQVVELPEWDGKAAATQNQRTEWDRFKAAITAHENGHVATDVKSFANAHVKIKAKPTVAEADAEFSRIVEQANTDNATYDTGNDHGRSAGTTINPNIDEVTKVP